MQSFLFRKAREFYTIETFFACFVSAFFRILGCGVVFSAGKKGGGGTVL